MPSIRAASKAGRARRAILKDNLPCCADKMRAVAPRGEYDIVDGDEGTSGVGLCSCSTKNRFTLSFDAFLQHLNEGRIAVTG